MSSAYFMILHFDRTDAASLKWSRNNNRPNIDPWGITQKEVLVMKDAVCNGLVGSVQKGSCKTILVECL